MDTGNLPDTVQAAFHVIGPFLQFLYPLGQKVWDKAQDELSTAALEKAKSVWGKLRPKVEESPAALEAFQDAALEPDDPDVQAALRHQLKKILETDPAFAEEVAKLVGNGPMTANTAVAVGPGSIATAGNISSSLFVTGQGNVVKS